MDEVKSYDGRLVTPMSMIVYGSSQSGKTRFTLDLIREWPKLCESQLSKVILCYVNDQPAYDELGSILKARGCVLEKYLGFPEAKLSNPDTFDIPQGTEMCIILDDMLSTNCCNSKVFTKLFTDDCHHAHCNILFLCQDLFRGKLLKAHIYTI